MSVSPLNPGDQLPISSHTIFGAPDRLESSGVARILQGAVTGAYTFVHRLMPPQVEVRPAHAGESITVQETDQLHLKGGRRTITAPAVLDLVVWFDRAGDESLVEVGLPPRGQVPAAAPPRRARVPVDQPTRPRPRLVVRDVPPDPPPGPDWDAPLPDALQAVCAREGVDRRLGDYVVVPETCLPGEPLPAGVVRSPRVTQVHIVQRRLGRDTTIEDIG